jgi:hypothetical protein
MYSNLKIHSVAREARCAQFNRLWSNVISADLEEHGIALNVVFW